MMTSLVQLACSALRLERVRQLYCAYGLVEPKVRHKGTRYVPGTAVIVLFLTHFFNRNRSLCITTPK